MDGVRRLTFDSVLLHSCHFFQRKSQSVYHEGYLRRIERVLLIKLDSHHK